ncbi:MAG: CaiB/BaiF CoA transferase family protein, partial [Dehalococcoidia bacterium]
MLSPYRVLDLTSGLADIGPMILADLGADVIKVEPPGGSPGRQAEPRLPDALGSARFHDYNRNKRSVTIDFDGAAGRARFLDLVRGADFLMEDAPAGAMAARGLGWEQLRAVNPGLVYVASSPFGQDGPYAHHLSTDLTLAAMGGMVAVNGDPDRAPVRISIPQTWLHAGAESAVAALVAHQRRLQTGEGQFADLSVQASVFWTGLNSMIAHAVQGRNYERNGTLLDLSVIVLKLCFPCKDGEVVLLASGPAMIAMIGWMAEEGIVPASWLTDEDWKTYDVRMLTGGTMIIPYAEVLARIGDYCLQHGKQELLELGLAANVTIAPVSRVDEVLAFRHLEERKYWQPYPLADGRTVRIPGPFVRLEETPIAITRPAPAPGEHTAEVLAASRAPAAVPPASPAGLLPFAGLKVADFSWIGVGPITAKYFADHGADVVRVETASPADRLRAAGPHKDGVPGVNRSQFFGAFNTSKKGMTLNLKDPAAQAIAKKLLAWCDVAIESFTPGTMADLGLGYDVARELNPGIIMVSSCLMGQTGPAAKLAGYGYHAAAISGFYELTGWDDRPPAGPFNAYTDVIAPHFLAATVMAALDHRRRTGQGQYIEQAQMESALHFLAPEFIDHQVTGAVPRRAGNDSPYAAPHNTYPAAGEDQWIAIACETDEQWQALRAGMGNPAGVADPAFDSLAGRLAARREIDTTISAWTTGQERYALMAALQAAGVPAGVVQRSSDLQDDPQLAHRHFFRPMVHAEMGEIPYEGHMFRIAGYENGPRFPAPCLGADTYEVLTGQLGMTDDEAAEALASGA